MEHQHEVVLSGCRPTPLAGYLRGLAVLRLVCEQVDRDATGWWENEVFHIRSTLNGSELSEFLTERYVPTPIVAPWNGGSGFYPKDSTEALMKLRGTRAKRLKVYASTIRTSQSIVTDLGLTSRPQNEDKSRLLRQCRSQFPDAAIEWLDAAVVLTTDAMRFPPLLGTGGNDGRLEFTNNFMQRLLDVIEPDAGTATPDSLRWLQAALFGQSASGLVRAAVGQFFPGSAGGPNSRAHFEGDSLVNPWDFVLMLEGALVFAASATKRLDVSRRAAMSYPFTVNASGVGYGSISQQDEDSARAEMWLPLWSQPMSFAEIAHIFREGRAQVHGRPARNGVDFARACAALAVDRGIDSFQRYSFLKRSGKSFLAVPLNRVGVRRNVQADLLNDLDGSGWLDSLQQFAKSDTFSSAVRSVEDAMFQLCEHPGTFRVQQLLMALGRIEQLLGKRPKVREAVGRPLVLRSQNWLEEADDNSDEFLLACGIVSLYSPNHPRIRAYFSPVKAHRPAEWDAAESPRVVWQQQSLSNNLHALIQRRLLDAASEAKREKTIADESSESDKPFGGAFKVPLNTVLRYLHGTIDERKISALVWGLLPLSASGALPAWSSQRPSPAKSQTNPQIPWAFATIKLLATPNRELRRLKQLATDIAVPLPREVLSILTSGGTSAVKRASGLAEQRLLASGMRLAHRGVRSPGVAGMRLAAITAFPLSLSDTAFLVKHISEAPERERANPEEGHAPV